MASLLEQVKEVQKSLPNSAAGISRAFGRPSQRNFSDEEFDLAIAYIEDRISVPQLCGALGIKTYHSTALGWVMSVTRWALRTGKIKRT